MDRLEVKSTKINEKRKELQRLILKGLNSGEPRAFNINDFKTRMKKSRK